LPRSKQLRRPRAQPAHVAAERAALLVDVRARLFQRERQLAYGIGELLGCLGVMLPGPLQQECDRLVAAQYVDRDCAGFAPPGPGSGR
jgi:hypothetical protein